MRLRVSSRPLLTTTSGELRKLRKLMRPKHWLAWLPTLKASGVHNLTDRYIVHPAGAAAAPNRFGANMGEVIRFISKSERERARLIREARATYDSIFPPLDPVSEH